MTVVPVYARGAVVAHSQVDADDADKVMAFRWRMNKGRYAAANIPNSGKPSKTLSMHRLVMDAPPGQVIDHINGDTLDNRRCNLRRCTHAENMRNARGHAGRSLPKGVYRTRGGKFKAQIMAHAVHLYLGTFTTIEQARAARIAAEAKHHGAFAAHLGTES